MLQHTPFHSSPPIIVRTKVLCIAHLFEKLKYRVEYTVNMEKKDKIPR